MFEIMTLGQGRRQVTSRLPFPITKRDIKRAEWDGQLLHGRPHDTQLDVVAYHKIQISPTGETENWVLLKDNKVIASGIDAIFRHGIVMGEVFPNPARF